MNFNKERSNRNKKVKNVKSELIKTFVNVEQKNVNNSMPLSAHTWHA